MLCLVSGVQHSDSVIHISIKKNVYICSFFLFLNIYFYLFIYLAAPDLSCGMQDLLVVACRI